MTKLEMLELPWAGSQSFISSWKLVRKIKKFITTKEDHRAVFHLAEPGSTRAFIRFGWLISPEIRFILTIHGSELLRFTRNPIEKWLFKKLLSRCSRIHVLSKFNERNLIGIFPSTKEVIRRIPGAPATGVSPQKQDPENQNKSKTIQIVCVGRIHPRKGQNQILFALSKLPEETQKKLHLRFVGPIKNPKYLSHIQNLSGEFSGKVTFDGDCTDEELVITLCKIRHFCPHFPAKTKKCGGFRVCLPGGFRLRSTHYCKPDRWCRRCSAG